MLTEEDLDHYMIWNGYTAQSREATRPELVRGVRWLAKVGLTRSPLQAPLSPSPDARLRRIVHPRQIQSQRGRRRHGRSVAGTVADARM